MSETHDCALEQKLNKWKTNLCFACSPQCLHPNAVTEINDHADFRDDFHKSLRYENIQMLTDETVKGYRSMSTFYIQSMLVFRLIFGPM